MVVVQTRSWRSGTNLPPPRKFPRTNAVEDKIAKDAARRDEGTRGDAWQSSCALPHPIFVVGNFPAGGAQLVGAGPHRTRMNVVQSREIGFLRIGRIDRTGIVGDIQLQIEIVPQQNWRAQPRKIALRPNAPQRSHHQETGQRRDPPAPQWQAQTQNSPTAAADARPAGGLTITAIRSRRCSEPDCVWPNLRV